MRENKRSSAAQSCILCLCATLGFVVNAADAPPQPAAPAPAPVPAPAPTPPAPVEVTWDAIETWASGAADAPKSADAGKKSDVKTPDAKAASGKPAQPDAPAGQTTASPAPANAVPPAATALTPEVKPLWTPAHAGERRQEPIQTGAIRQIYIAHADPLFAKAVNAHDLDKAYWLSFNMERYTVAGTQLVTMKNDPKRFPNHELFVKERWIATGLMLNPQPHPDIDALFKEWKPLATARAAQETDVDLKQSQLNNIAKTEEMLNIKPSIADFISKHEIAGDGDPNALWELCMHLDNGHPKDPLRYACTLYKLREWFPEFEAVKSGDVQWRLCGTLAWELELHKEAADEARIMADTHPTHDVVKDGQAMWMECEQRRMQGEETNAKRDQIDIFRVARDKYKEFQTKFPLNGHNKIQQGDKKTDAQAHLDELNKHVSP